MRKFLHKTSMPLITSGTMLVIFKDTGVEIPRESIAYVNTATALSVAAGALQVALTCGNGTNKIFKL